MTDLNEGAAAFFASPADARAARDLWQRTPEDFVEGPDTPRTTEFLAAWATAQTIRSDLYAFLEQLYQDVWGVHYDVNSWKPLTAEVVSTLWPNHDPGNVEWLDGDDLSGDGACYYGVVEFNKNWFGGFAVKVLLNGQASLWFCCWDRRGEYVYRLPALGPGWAYDDGECAFWRSGGLGSIAGGKLDVGLLRDAALDAIRAIASRAKFEVLVT